MFEIGQGTAQVGNKRKTLSIDSSIDVGLSSHVLELFLDMVNVPNPTAPDLVYPNSLMLYEFCIKFDIIKRLKDLIESIMLKNARSYPWALLIWSSEREDLPMARKALGLMTSSRFVTPKLPDRQTHFWELMSRLPIDGQYDLLRSGFPTSTCKAYSSDSSIFARHTSYYANDSQLSALEDWNETASQFNPQKRFYKLPIV
ncbi:uncharacterized protein L201_000793 [Kwoniella dendrophila CBS 6074]|uniref:Uncharacterized protein n=1 Tax=Kwoniella dendrophila CBS 6074 TaxID=1295534 RepID=A0AAX4JLX2_9TREE